MTDSVTRLDYLLYSAWYILPHKFWWGYIIVLLKLLLSGKWSWPDKFCRTVFSCGPASFEKNCEQIPRRSIMPCKEWGNESKIFLCASLGLSKCWGSLIVFDGLSSSWHSFYFTDTHCCIVEEWTAVSNQAWCSCGRFQGPMRTGGSAFRPSMASEPVKCSKTRQVGSTFLGRPQIYTQSKHPLLGRSYLYWASLKLWKDVSGKLSPLFMHGTCRVLG